MEKVVKLNKPVYCAFSGCDKRHERIEGFAAKIVGKEIYCHRKGISSIILEDCIACYGIEQGGRGVKYRDVIIKYK